MTEQQHSHASVDYESVPDKSMWGGEDEATLSAIEKAISFDKWLNLAAGDGRFNNTLLRRCDSVIAADNDPRALRKLVRLTLPEHRNKLEIAEFDLTQKFPFDDSSFNGCFCIATLHIFPRSIVQFIVSEMKRVVCDRGLVIFDFRTDTRRTLPDGNLYIYPGEESYTSAESRALIDECLEGQRYDVLENERGPHQTDIGPLSYVYRSHCFLVSCQLQK